MSIIERLRASSVAPLLALIVLLAVGSTIYQKISLRLRRRKFARENGCKELRPEAHKTLFLGISNVKERMQAVKEKRALEFGGQMFKDNGPTWTVDVIGLPIPGLHSRKIIMTIDPENVKAILSLRFKDFSLGDRDYTLGVLLGRGIFTTDGEDWAHSRAMVRPNFARDQVADLASFERLIQILFKILPTDGSTVDLQELFFKYTIDSATEFLFGESTNTLKAMVSGGRNSAAEQFAISFNIAQEYCATRARSILRGFSSFFQDPAGKDAITICHAFVDTYVDRAVAYREKSDLDYQKNGETKEDKYVFLHELAKSTTDKRRLRDELLNILLAGRDTTASLLANMWFMITQRPEIMKKLKNEVDELGGEVPTYEQVRSMKYLKYCMNECK
jgi:cytochrome P450